MTFLLLFALLAMGALAMTVHGIYRAVRAGQTGWVAAMAFGLFVGLGWVVAFVYRVEQSRRVEPADG